MAINGIDKEVVRQQVTSVATTEGDFRSGLDDIIDQVDSTEQALENAALDSIENLTGVTPADLQILAGASTAAFNVTNAKFKRLGELDSATAHFTFINGADTAITHNEFNTLKGMRFTAGTEGGTIQDQLDRKLDFSDIDTGNGVGITETTGDDGDLTFSVAVDIDATKPESGGLRVDTDGLSHYVPANSPVADITSDPLVDAGSTTANDDGEFRVLTGLTQDNLGHTTAIQERAINLNRGLIATAGTTGKIDLETKIAKTVTVATADAATIKDAQGGSAFDDDDFSISNGIVTIKPQGVDFAEIVNTPGYSFLGNNDAAAGTTEALGPSAARGLLANDVGDAVALITNSDANDFFIRGDGNWAIPEYPTYQFDAGAIPLTEGARLNLNDERAGAPDGADDDFIDFNAGSDIDITVQGDNDVLIAHQDVTTGTSTKAGVTVDSNGTFTYLSGATISQKGHVTDLESQTVTLQDFARRDTQNTFTEDNTFEMDVVINGNFSVRGTTTTIETETVEIHDNFVLLNSDATGTPTQNAGIEVERGSATNSAIRWNEGTDHWEFSDAAGSYDQFAAVGDISNATITLDGGTYLTAESDNQFNLNQTANEIVTINHDNTSRTNTTTASNTLTSEESFTAITSVLSNATGHLTGVNTATYKMPTLGSLASRNSVGAAQIDANAVGASEIAANAVGASEIAANAVGASELANNAVDTAAIANDAVTAAKLAHSQALPGNYTATTQAAGNSSTRLATTAFVQNAMSGGGGQSVIAEITVTDPNGAATIAVQAGDVLTIGNFNPRGGNDRDIRGGGFNGYGIAANTGNKVVGAVFEDNTNNAYSGTVLHWR